MGPEAAHVQLELHAPELLFAQQSPQAQQVTQTKGHSELLSFACGGSPSPSSVRSTSYISAAGKLRLPASRKPAHLASFYPAQRPRPILAQHCNEDYIRSRTSLQAQHLTGGTECKNKNGLPIGHMFADVSGQNMASKCSWSSTKLQRSKLRNMPAAGMKSADLKQSSRDKASASHSVTMPARLEVRSLERQCFGFGWRKSRAWAFWACRSPKARNHAPPPHPNPEPPKSSESG